MTVDPCPSCGAAMAADQRYCLACGDRRAEARLNYLEVLRGPARTAEPAAPPGPALAAVQRQRANTAVIAGIGCLLLALGVGVLIGTAGNGESAAAPAAAAAPQVIRLQGGGAAPATQTTAGKAERKRKAASGDAGTAATAADSKATNPELQALENASPEDYQKQSQKLPKVVSTGGKAPPKDDKAPAAGGGFEEIG